MDRLAAQEDSQAQVTSDNHTYSNLEESHTLMHGCIEAPQISGTSMAAAVVASDLKVSGPLRATGHLPMLRPPHEQPPGGQFDGKDGSHNLAGQAETAAPGDRISIGHPYPAVTAACDSGDRLPPLHHPQLYHHRSKQGEPRRYYHAQQQLGKKQDSQHRLIGHKVWPPTMTQPFQAVTPWTHIVGDAASAGEPLYVTPPLRRMSTVIAATSPAATPPAATSPAATPPAATPYTVQAPWMVPPSKMLAMRAMPRGDAAKGARLHDRIRTRTPIYVTPPLPRDRGGGTGPATSGNEYNRQNCQRTASKPAFNPVAARAGRSLLDPGERIPPKRHYAPPPLD
eukprot:GHVU01103136.1.p1 GENE.GHVU01103136.1~~GHVU01103136.1.p1  ORF type:complete len:340 (+),score=36.64 GHVU01103136.1:6421-7440(+)